MVNVDVIHNFKYFISTIYTVTSSLTLGIVIFIYMIMLHLPLAIWGGILSYNYFYKCNSKKVWLEFEKSIYDFFLEEHSDIQKTIIYKLFAYFILYSILFVYKIINFLLFIFIFVFTLFVPYVFLLFYFLFIYLQNKCPMEGLADLEKVTGIDIDSSGYEGDAGKLLSNNPCAKECSNVLKNKCNKNAKETEKKCKEVCNTKATDEMKSKNIDTKLNLFNQFFNSDYKKIQSDKKECTNNCKDIKKDDENNCQIAFKNCYSKCTDPEDELEEALITQDYKKEYAQDLSDSAERAWEQTTTTAESARRRAESTGNSSVQSIKSAEEQQREGFYGIFGAY